MANPPVVQRGPTQTFQDEVVINDELTLHSNTLTRQLLSDIFPTFDSLLCDPDMWRVVHACFMFRQFQCRRLAPPLLTPALPVGAKLIPVVGHGIEKLEFKLFSFIFYECDPIYTWYMKMLGKKGLRKKLSEQCFITVNNGKKPNKIVTVHRYVEAGLDGRGEKRCSQIPDSLMPATAVKRKRATPINDVQKQILHGHLRSLYAEKWSKKGKKLQLGDILESLKGVESLNMNQLKTQYKLY